ncbi:MAG: helix-turn-helix domain-containing protein, partial [Actinobacteria bacterium]
MIPSVPIGKSAGLVAGLYSTSRSCETGVHLLEPRGSTTGARLAQARRRMGWSQRELAARWGRSESLVSKIEQGAKRLDSLDDARR